MGEQLTSSSDKERAEAVEKGRGLNPYVLGAMLGLFIFAMVIVMWVLFPKLGAAWDRNGKAIRDVWFTVVLHGLLTSRIWGMKKKFAALTILSIFLVIHTIALITYTIRVQPLLVWQWIGIAGAESAVIFSFLEWSMNHLERLGRKTELLCKGGSKYGLEQQP